MATPLTFKPAPTRYVTRLRSIRRYSTRVYNLMILYHNNKPPALPGKRLSTSVYEPLWLPFTPLYPYFA
jgi:hypothetical protein